MNTLLEVGVVASDWKMAIVRPLLKKVGLELIHSNYRPVSYLPFKKSGAMCPDIVQ